MKLKLSTIFDYYFQQVQHLNKQKCVLGKLHSHKLSYSTVVLLSSLSSFTMP